ncbi:MAG TPA: lysylphosphatidylglycerol synthase transmembrane domain-containing protein [Leifsonia sp.]
MTGPRIRLTARILVGGGVLVALLARVGAGPFVHGLLSLNAPAIGAAILLVGIATAAAAWRWRLIARRLGLALPWSTALRMYYRSQLVNTMLPGGVIGDVQRAVDHGAAAGADRAGTAARAVAVERIAGQVVQLLVAVPIIVLLGAGFAGVLLPALVVGLAAAAAIALATALVAAGSPRLRLALRHEAEELRAGLGSVAASIQVVTASGVVVGCHVATFAVAAAAVGVSVPPARLLTLTVVVLLAASIPLNIGGWGPREGVAGWAFAVAGLGASAGVSSATLYGVLALIAVAPGVAATTLASLITRRNHRVRATLRDPQLRHLPRRVPRHGPPAPARALEPGGLRPGG